MALTKTTEIAQMEVVGQYKAVQVATDTVVKEDGVEISRSYQRHIVSPNSDISNESEDVQAMARQFHTDAVKKAYADHMAKVM